MKTMNLILQSSRMLAAGIALTCAAAASAGGPSNDECSTPMVIAGTGVFPFDLTGATTSPEGQNNPSCAFSGTTAIRNDLWYCWTAPCTGLARISTCGQTQVNTKIAMYLGCACPVTPDDAFCCDDDGCAPTVQTELLCDVICGEQYLIQVGQAPDGLPPGAGTFTIECMGEPCDDPGELCVIEPGQCCAGRPRFTDPAFVGFNGLIAVETASPLVAGGDVLKVFDFSTTDTAPFNVNYPVARYSDPSWTATTLGSIFGLTFDDDGNIYTTTSTCYAVDVTGIGGWGDVYRVDGVTGVVSVFATLPNTGPGLGNISYDCANDQFFVTNHEDGKIYRISSTGVILSTFDHAGPDDGAAGFAPLRERLWGVEVHAGRVYYAVWSEDAGRPNAAIANEIWSVPIAGGDFSGVAQMEISIPSNPGTDYSNPVSDIRFTPTGSMLLAEKAMGDDTNNVPHDARGLEFVCDAAAGGWVPSPNTFAIGIPNGGTNSSGGVDVDYATGGKVWFSGHALQLGNPDQIYGMQGLPATGGGLANSVLIDYQGNVIQQDKDQIGDMILTCGEPCAVVSNVEVECEIGSDGTLSGNYILCFDLTNFSGTNAQYLLFPNSQVTPNIITLNPILPGDGSVTQTICVTLTGLKANEEFCFNVILADENVEECCAVEICVETPACDCMILSEVVLECDPDNPGGYLISFTMTNLTPDTIEHLFLFPLPVGSTVVLSPDYIDTPAIPPFGSFAVGPISISGVNPGEVLCIRVSIHNDSLEECCSDDTLCVQFPDCPPGVTSPCDFDGDGFIDFDDLVFLLANWGPCPPNSPCLADVDGDGAVDFDDMTLIFAQWGPVT